MVSIVRFQLGNEPSYGLLEDGIVYAASGNPFTEMVEKAQAIGPLDSLTLYPPVEPSKIVAIGLNYLDHITEDAPNFQQPENPIIFLKPPSSLTGSGQPIVLPAGPEHVDSEAELCIVIGRQARYVEEHQAHEYILGYTCGNDVSARDYQFKDGQWVRAKGFDTFTPLGPVIATGLDPSNLAVTCRLNGELRQSSSTAKLLFSVPYLVQFVSRVMTLEPGDVIMTGTPAHPPQMQVGDVVEVEIEGIGVLRNPVA
ncbi:MAG TPA: fumarylacetoacetate hydrolase family protein, partial [Thermomicrobiaceae bacterium]|nr:fumarylacetoacetate hydrolase family protein [Thermomicrobiaceae bacterium]